MTPEQFSEINKSLLEQVKDKDGAIGISVCVERLLGLLAAAEWAFSRGYRG